MRRPMPALFRINLAPVFAHASLAVIALSVLAACSAASSAEDKSPQTRRSFAFSNFDAVALQGPDTVKIVEGAAFSVVATGPAKTLEKIEISLKDGALKIDRKRQSGMSWYSNEGKGVLVTVTMPSIKSASIGGSGDMDVDTPVTGDFEGAIGGSGDMRIAKVSGKSIDLSIGGSGNIQAKGVADTGDFSIAGSGNIDASGLMLATVAASIAGSGDIRAAARGKASASIVGSGDIVVTGTKDCSISKVGSGAVRCDG
jgi:Putative auto-transporter adhesin, head GIN domain